MSLRILYDGDTDKKRRLFLMRSLEEHEIFATVVGTPLNIERLSRIAAYHGHGVGDYVDCEEYVVEELTVIGKELVRRFRITDALLERWECGGILFCIYLFVRNEILVGGHVFKYKRVLEKRCCNAGYETSPTQQEIRITHRVLQYLIEENS